MKSINTILQKIHPAKEITLYTNLSPAIVTQRLTNETYYNEAVIKLYGWIIQKFWHSGYLFLGKVSGNAFVVRRMLKHYRSKNSFIPLVKGEICKDENGPTVITARIEFDYFQKFFLLMMLVVPPLIVLIALFKGVTGNEVFLVAGGAAFFMIIGWFLPSFLFDTEVARGKAQLKGLLEAKEAELKK